MQLLSNYQKKRLPTCVRADVRMCVTLRDSCLYMCGIVFNKVVVSWRLVCLPVCVSRLQRYMVEIIARFAYVT